MVRIVMARIITYGIVIITAAGNLLSLLRVRVWVGDPDSGLIMVR